MPVLFLFSLQSDADQASLKAGEWFRKGSGGGNKIKLLLTGKDLHGARLKLIRSATRSLYLSAYSINNEPSSLEIMDTICQQKRKNPDLEVRIVVDEMGS